MTDKDLLTENNQLRMALRAQVQETERVKAVVLKRGIDIMDELMDGLNLCCDQAEAGHPQAKAKLESFLNSLVRAQSAIGKIVVLRN